MLLLQDIDRQKTANAGGLARVEYIFERDLLSMPRYRASSHFYEGALLLRGDATSKYLYHTTGTYREGDQDDARHGAFVRSQLTVRHPHDRAVLAYLRRRLRNERVTLFFQDNNGHWSILPGARATSATDRSNRGGYNGTEFTFALDSRHGAGFWRWEQQPYIEFYLDPADTPASGSGGTSPTDPNGNDTNLANTNLQLTGHRTHDLGNYRLRFTGGDLEILDEQRGLIFHDAGRRFRLRITAPSTSGGPPILTTEPLD